MNLRRLSLLALLGAFAVAATACSDVSLSVGDDRVSGSGRTVSEVRRVPAFDRIALTGEGRVVVTTGTAQSLVVETDDNLLDHIETAVVGTTLTLSTPGRIDLEPSESITYRIGVPDLRGIRLDGVGSFDLGGWATTAADVSLTGVGEIRVAGLHASSLDVDMTGVGSISIDGSVDGQSVRKTGVGTYRAGDLESRTASLVTDGPGSSRLWVTETLSISAGGIGSVEYFGSPSVDQDTSGIVAVRSLGPRATS